jgi:glycogen phosphorylase
MKAAANGALNLSVLDGWWAEGWARYGNEVGWAIGRGEEYTDAEGDHVEAEELYDLLEREVVPLYFQRDATSSLETRRGQNPIARDRLPRAWIKRMKGAISKLVPEFNTARMVREYAERFYVPSIRLSHEMMDENLAGATKLASWKQRVREAWPQVEIKDLTTSSPSELKVGEAMRVEASVQLGPLTPSDVAVELYHGPTAGGHELLRGEVVRMRLAGNGGAPGVYRFTGEIPTKDSGAHAFAARVMPWNASMSHPYETSLVRWG